MKVAELTGVLLDYWVAKAMGWQKADRRAMGWGDGPDVWITGDENSPTYQDFRPSSSWGCGGPIIEREKIYLEPLRDGWEARREIWTPSTTTRGDAPLVAAMRCYVASRFGEEVLDEVAA